MLHLQTEKMKLLNFKYYKKFFSAVANGSKSSIDAPYAHKKLVITVDTEAHTLRAERDHVRRLIWGEFNGREYGIRRMMDIADAYNVPLTFFLDLPEYTYYGDDILDVGKEILHRGHDVQIHMHPEMFSPEFLQRHDIHSADICFPYLKEGMTIADHIRRGKQGWKPIYATKKNLYTYINECINIYSQITSEHPSAIRTMGYKLTPDIIDGFCTATIPISCNYNPSFPDRAPFLSGILPPFYWSEDVLELPVSCISRYNKIYQYNFNTSLLLNADTETCVKRHIDFLNQFYNESEYNTVAVLVLHSWSFLKMDTNGWFTIPNEHAVATFDNILKELSRYIDIISLKDVAANREKFFPKLQKTDYIANGYSISK